MDAGASAPERGLREGFDARALTSLAALALAMTVVCAIAIVGHRKHSANASAQRETVQLPPLVNEGVEIPTPAINVSHPEP